MTGTESCMNLVPTGGVKTAMTAPVPGMESAAAPGELRAAVGVFLHCHDTAQSTSLHTGVPKK